MIDSSEVHVLDRNAEFFGVPTEKLMENAGKSVANFVHTHYCDGKILVLCGMGNNGGDGFVAARYLVKNYPVVVFLLGLETDIHSPTARMNFEKLKNLSVSIYDINHLKEITSIIEGSTIILDAMLGIGLVGSLREPYASVVQALNTVSGKTIIAVDVPTGFGTQVSVHPQYCITFHDKKTDMDETSCGDIIIADIGIPQAASLYVGPGDLSVFYPKPKRSSHKGDNGRVLIVGGGPFFGAPALAGLAALRTGADLVYIASPKESAKIVASFSPNLIVCPMVNNDIFTSDDIPTILKDAEHADAVIVGPGLGINSETIIASRLLVTELSKMKKPFVLDADGLKALAKCPDLLKHSNAVITPHCGEFEVFSGEMLSNNFDKRTKIITMWAKRLDITILLKAPIDIITNGKSTKLNNVHNEAMTVGGTGDVLAGIIGALLSKKSTPYNAARISAFLNGEAGNQAFSLKSYGLLATDVIEAIPSVLKKYL